MSAQERVAAADRKSLALRTPFQAPQGTPPQPAPAVHDLYRRGPSGATTVAALGQFGSPPAPLTSHARPAPPARHAPAPNVPAAVGAGLGTKSYSCDANGNLTATSDGDTFSWDFDDRLTKVVSADGTVIEHTYDVDGNRVRTQVNVPGRPPEITDFLVDVSGPVAHVVAETDGVTGQVKAVYNRTDSGELLSVMRPRVPVPTTPADWQTRQVHADGVGSVRALTDETGAVTDTYTYTASGELIARTGTDPQPYAFAGEPRDPFTGLQYHRARWLDPAQGRFLGMDPFSGVASEPVTLHRYLYAGADPVNNADPSGRFFVATALTALQGFNTIAAVSVPNTRALVHSSRALEIVPVLLADNGGRSARTLPKRRPFAGWPHSDVDIQLLTASNFWHGRHKIPVRIQPERHGTVADADVCGEGDLSAKAATLGFSNQPLHVVPVLFSRVVYRDSGCGTLLAGLTSTLQPRHPASIALTTPGPSGGSDPFLLAHELGHVFSLENEADAGTLMSKVHQAWLRPDQIRKANAGFTLRVGPR